MTPILLETTRETPVFVGSGDQIRHQLYDKYPSEGQRSAIDLVARLTTVGAVAIDWLARGGTQSSRNPITKLASELFDIERNGKGANGVVFSQATSVEIAENLRSFKGHLGIARNRFKSVASEHYVAAIFGEKEFVEIPEDITPIQRQLLDFAHSPLGKVLGGAIQRVFRIERVMGVSTITREAAVQRILKEFDKFRSLDLGYVSAMQSVDREIKQIAGPHDPAILLLYGQILVAAENYFGISGDDLKKLHYAVMFRDHGIMVSIEE